MTGDRSNRPRLAMIGVDAGELDFIQTHLSLLPNFRHVFERSRPVRLGSTAGLFPGSVWPTFYTGTMPGSHGIYHHLQWDPDAMRLRRVSEDWLYSEPFWYQLARRGLQVSALDVPMTFPCRESSCLEVINWGSHDQLCRYGANPSRLVREISRTFGRHPMGAEIPVDKSVRQLERIRGNLVEGAHRKGELARWIMEKRHWDLFLVVFGETHRGGHILWPGVESDGADLTPILDVYRAVDEGIGSVLGGLSDDDMLVVFALHGMGYNTSQEHFVPQVMDRLNSAFLGAGPSNSESDGAKQRSPMRVLREAVPSGVQNAIARIVPVSVRDVVVARQTTGGYAWQHTPGLALLADLNAYLRFNIEGRERDGILDPGGERLREYSRWLRDGFAELCVDGTCDPLVGAVVRTEEVCEGQRLDYLPDLVVTWTGREPAARVSSERIGRIDAELATGRGGNHRFEGFCSFYGGAGDPGRAFTPSHISEIAPAVLRLFESTRA